MRRLLLLGCWLPHLLFAQSLVPDIDESTGLWGYRDSTGGWAIAPGYQAVTPFHQGRALVTVDEVKYIGPNGSVFPPFSRMKNSRIWRPQHVIDATGRVKFSLPTGYMTDAWAVWGEGLLPVRDPRGRYGYLDTAGRVAIPFRFARAWSFGQQVAAVQVPEAHFDSLYFSLGAAQPALQDSLDLSLRRWRQKLRDAETREAFPYGGLRVVWIDRQGQVLQFLPAQYHPPERGAFRFSEGVIPVWHLFRRAYGLLDQQLRVALPFVYQQLGVLSEGCLFAVRRPTQQPTPTLRLADDQLFVGYIDLAGEPVFRLPNGFLTDCQYRVVGLPVWRQQGLIWLYPGRRCTERVGLRVGTDGQLLSYFRLRL